MMEELIKIAKHDEKARNELWLLVKEYFISYFVLNYITTNYKHRENIEDLLQELYIHYIISLDKFSPCRGKYRVYIYLYTFKDTINYFYAKKEGVSYRTYLEKKENKETVKEESYTIDEQLEYEDRLKVIEKRFKELLSKNEYKVMMYVLAGYRLSEIRFKVKKRNGENSSHQNIWSAFNSAKKKIGIK